ncbi:sensor histidine kinase [Nonomuraea terrae]|uniref:Sensor histidine kinase n=1 Tax=Nonomuraea terrae TaxID=2530383 RepID=A0A4R4YVR0_9ACTN|nr:sensor histidine kinase [Nonomuraea terrae]TDD47752.1 sensor histidine kinase [Nonomuraea terrae]
MSRLDRPERWIYTALAYALLAISTVVAALSGDFSWDVFGLGGGADPDGGAPARAAPRAGLPLPGVPWLALPPWPVSAVVAALWLAPIPWLHARRDTRRVLVVGHYVVLIALAGAMVVQSAAFVVFASIGYPLAIALLPARLTMAGVTLTAMVNVAAQAGPGARATLPAVLAGVALPLVLAGWYVSGEHDRRRRLVERLRAALDENATLNARLLDQARRAGVLDERNRMAGEIHDTVAQDLVALIGQIDAAGRAGHGAAGRRHLDRAGELARRGLSEVRRSVRALRPEPLEDARLPEAIGDMARSWADAAGVELRLEVTGTPAALSQDVEAALFRVAQEALANVAKHAAATRTGLTLSYTDDLVLLDIRDDGTGFAPQTPSDGFGLDSMRQRVRSVGGTLEIESARDEGTAVAATVPIIPTSETP